MDPERAAQYASMSPEEFVKTRFYSEEYSFLDRFSDSLPSKPGAQSSRTRHNLRPAVSADGRMVVTVAHYNNTNYYQLTRPRQNLQLYCEARHGQWRRVQSYENDPIAKTQIDLATIYSDTEIHTLNELRRQNGDAGYAPAESAVAANAGAIATRRAAMQNEQMASAYSWSGFRKAINEGAFGVFRCDEAAAPWSVSIIPNDVYPSGNPSDSLDTASALVVIRPFRAEAPRDQAVDVKSTPNPQ